MSDDIVARLRELACISGHGELGDAADYIEHQHVSHDAMVLEIERLRADIAHLVEANAAERERAGIIMQAGQETTNVLRAALEKMDGDARWTISDVEHDLTDMRLRAEHAEAERDALRAQLAEAREALKPFAALWDVEETYLIGGMYKLTVRYENIRRARTVLNKIKGCGDE